MAVPGLMTVAAGGRHLILALGSGGTRGFAHLGVIKTLLEAGVRIDGICGASAGALFGALFAMEGTVDAVVGGTQTTPIEILSLYRDRLRLAPSNALGRRLVAHFGDRQIEALPVPMSILAVDLETGEEVQIREGSLLSALEASIAIPVLAQPVALNGRYLIDGGYGFAGPAVAARAMGAGVVVEVNLGVRRALPLGLDRLATRATTQIRAGKARFVRARRAALGVATLLMGDGAPQPPAADLVISPPLDELVPHSPFAAAKAFRCGEAAALDALPALRRLVSAGV
jgi:NTE family protein